MPLRISISPIVTSCELAQPQPDNGNGADKFKGNAQPARPLIREVNCLGTFRSAALPVELASVQRSAIKWLVLDVRHVLALTSRRGSSAHGAFYVFSLDPIRVSCFAGCRLRHGFKY